MTKKKPAPLPPKNTSGAKLLPHDLGLDSIPFSALVDNRMRVLKAKTGITPNILARFGFCLSLEEPGVPADPFEDEKEGREIKRVTLLGEHDLVYVCLLRSWLAANAPDKSVSQEEFDNLFVAHMNRGFELISSRMRSLADLQNIVPQP
jgi:DNA sulfur modification protein DndE